MGNQEIKAKMAKIQDTEFDPRKLDEFEVQLWQDHSTDNEKFEQLKTFKSLLEIDEDEEEEFFNLFSFRSNIDAEKSGED